MDPFTSHTGTAVALRMTNVDTDQIIPASYLKRITRTGFEDALFASWRGDPDFVLNRPEHGGASILVAGQDFGTGSSREHAVWALRDYGFRAVLSARFGDIFRGNSLKNGLLTVLVAQPVIEQLWAIIEADPTTELTVDLVNREVRAPGLTVGFELDDNARRRLLDGADDIALTLRHEAAITAYEATIPAFKPSTVPA